MSAPVNADSVVAAVRYAARGWHVVPLYSIREDGACDCGRSSCASPGKHPRTPHGQSDATDDANQIHEWWTLWPNANVGVVCRPSGIVVLDVDPRNGGDETLTALIEKSDALPVTLTADTGGGGQHYVFQHPGVKLPAHAGPGIDIKDDGYIVAAPSLHVSGKRYAWRDEEAPIADMPDWLRAGEKPAAAPQVEGKIRDGRRNIALASIAGTMRRRGLGEQEIVAALIEVNRLRCEPALPEEEVRGIAGSIARNYPPDGDLGEELYELSDVGNARRLVARHGADLRFSKGKGWLVWDGVRWRPSDSAAVQRAKELTDEMKRCAAAEPDATKATRLFKWALQSQNAAKIRSMVDLAKSEPEVEIEDDQLDADPWLFNCENGTLELRTGTLQSHQRDDLITKLSRVVYDPSARSERWEQFLLETTQHDEALLDYLQKAAGYTLTGDTSEEYLFFVHGPARTGKSTFMAAVKAVMGDYAVTADFETFLNKKFGGGTRNDIARLAGARFVSSIEVDEGQKLAEGLVKELTGGDKVSARFLYREFFEFKPQFKLWLCANHRPRVRSDDDAIWRRIRVLPFVNVVAPERQDRSLKTELTDIKASGPAILAWLVQGCMLWQKDGLGAPPLVTAATRDYQEDMDPLRDFFEERCERAASATVSKAELFRAYEEWAKEAGIKYPLKKKTFGQRLVATGIREAPGHAQGRQWEGIGLVDTWGVLDEEVAEFVRRKKMF
jgi:putative DNA primase/helicase